MGAPQTVSASGDFHPTRYYGEVVARLEVELEAAATCGFVDGMESVALRLCPVCREGYRAEKVGDDPHYSHIYRKPRPLEAGELIWREEDTAFPVVAVFPCPASDIHRMLDEVTGAKREGWGYYRAMEDGLLVPGTDDRWPAEWPTDLERAAPLVVPRPQVPLIGDVYGIDWGMTPRGRLAATGLKILQEVATMRPSANYRITDLTDESLRGPE
jgi:hypothetical protein